MAVPCCPERIGPFPIEFRLAIGASCTPGEFDGTAILNLSWRDPWVGTAQCGNLISLTVHDAFDPIWVGRVGVSKTTPQRLYRTGSGGRLAWDVTMVVATSRLGFLPPFASPKPEVNDGSLWHLASLFGLSAESVEFVAGSPYPPYLWLTTSYQHQQEQWFQVEIDPINMTTIDAIEFTPGLKTQARSLHVRFVSVESFKKAMPAYFPSLNVLEIAGITVTNIPPTTSAMGGWTTAITLSAPLPDKIGSQSIGLMDALLLNLNNGPYSWKLGTITAISDDRLTVTLLFASDISGASLVPPSDPIGIRSVIKGDRMLPTYQVWDYNGIARKRGPQQPLPSTAYLIGDPNDFS